MRKDKYPSIVPCSRSLQFQIGKDSRGNWVVQDDQGLCGGLFIDRTQALRFAMLENGTRPQAVVMVPGVLELDMNRKSANATRARQHQSCAAAESRVSE
jgi:hypothetical protein